MIAVLFLNLKKLASQSMAQFQDSSPCNLTVLQNKDVFAFKHFKLSYCPLTIQTDCRNCKREIPKNSYALHIIKINRLHDGGFCKPCTPIILRALLLAKKAQFVVFFFCLFALLRFVVSILFLHAVFSCFLFTDFYVRMIWYPKILFGWAVFFKQNLKALTNNLLLMVF